MIGKTISHYKILEKIGEGGMGEVYLAEDNDLHRQIAIKFLPRHLTDDEENILRFKQEAQAAASLNHPHIVTIHEISEEIDPATAGKQTYIVMEYVEGRTLRDLLNTSSQFPVPNVSDIIIQIAEGLSEAHKADIVHRDIKPDNIILTKDGGVKILDFGLAKLKGGSKLTKETSTLGTVQYMSPEQIQGQEVDFRSDIWSVGIVLYELLTGEPPFKGEYESALMYAIINEDPLRVESYRSDLSSEFLQILNRSLEKNPDERYQSIDEMLTDLQRLWQDSGSDSQKSSDKISVTVTKQKSPYSQIIYWIAAGAVGILIFLLALSFLSEGGSENKPFEKMQITRVTSHGKAKNAAISADGMYIIHVMENSGKESLWLRQVKTNSNVEILPPEDVKISGLTISKDGNYIYYLLEEKDRMTNSLYKLPILGGTPVKALDDVFSPIAFSPDGTKFSFVRYESFPSITMVMVSNLNGSKVEMLAKCRLPSVYSPFSVPAWSPDGRAIICVKAYTEDKYYLLVELNVNDGFEKQFCSQQWNSVVDMAWHTDNNGLVIVAKYKTSNRQIWYVSHPDRETRQITNDLNNYESICLTADGKSLLAVQSELNSNIWVASSGELSKYKKISVGRYDGANNVIWMPDGKILQASDDYKLWIMDSDGNNPRRLTPDERRDFSPTVSPDGQSIFFTTIRGNVFEIWEMNSDGTAARQIAPMSAYPRCTPDGNWIIYGSLVKGKFIIMKMSTKGGDPIQLIDKNAFGPDISPDGKNIVCYLGDESEPDKLQISLFPIEGGEPEKIFNLPNNVLPNSMLRWAPDGKSFTYVLNKDGVSNIWSHPVDKGFSRQLTNFKENKIFAFDWSPKGDLVCSRGEMNNDVVLIKEVK